MESLVRYETLIIGIAYRAVAAGDLELPSQRESPRWRLRRIRLGPSEFQQRCAGWRDFARPFAGIPTRA